MDVLFFFFKQKMFLDLLKSHLGSGAFGDVFEAVKLLTQKTMALKVIKLGVEGTDVFKANMISMEAEVQVGLKLGASCDFLVQLSEFFMEHQYCCLVMEYCAGGDLGKILKEKCQLPESV
jgi:serine/threonine protein kinase